MLRKKIKFIGFGVALSFLLVGSVYASSYTKFDNFFRYQATNADTTALEDSGVLAIVGGSYATMGQTIEGFVQVNTGDNSSNGVKVEIYRGAEAAAYSGNLDCTEWDYGNADLLQTIDVSDMSTNGRYVEEFSITVSEENGFSESYPNDNLVFKTVDSSGSLGLSECAKTSNSLLTIKPDVAYPDFRIKSVTPPASMTTDDAKSVYFDIENEGSVASPETEVCIFKRNLLGGEPLESNIASGSSTNCVTVPAMVAGGTYGSHIDLIYGISSFAWPNYFDNARLKKGENRLVLEVNPVERVMESDFTDNDYVFTVTISDNEAPAAISKNEATPTNQEENSQQSEQSPQTSAVTEGSLIKSPIHASVYKYKDGKRRPFPNSGTFYSWYENFDDVVMISADEMEDIPLGQPMSVKPGVGLVKFPYNPKVYEVLSDGVIKHIPNEASAVISYGLSWDNKIVTLPEIYYLFYTVE